MWNLDCNIVSGEFLGAETKIDGQIIFRIHLRLSPSFSAMIGTRTKARHKRFLISRVISIACQWDSRSLIQECTFRQRYPAITTHSALLQCHRLTDHHLTIKHCRMSRPDAAKRSPAATTTTDQQLLVFHLLNSPQIPHR